MVVIDMLVVFMKENGYDGLFQENGVCACKLGDLIPCQCDFSNCRFGYLSECDCGEGCLFHITDSPALKGLPNITKTVCVECGAKDFDDDGYCLECGRKQ